jgi:transcription-repair coupling factor (superfamily II helicase)
MTSRSLPDWTVELLPAESRAALGAALRGEGPALHASSLARSARSLALAALSFSSDRPLLVVTPNDPIARALAPELGALLGAAEAETVQRFPATDADPYRGIAAHPALAARRVAVLDSLVDGRTQVVVAPVEALLVPVPAGATLARWARTIGRGSEVDLDELALAAVTAGYRVVDVVGSPGDFARRGGLFDIWPPQEPLPLRVELFGDEVDSVRRFEVATQRTVTAVERFRMLPAREAPIGTREADALLDRLFGRAREVLVDDLGDEEDVARLASDRLAGLEAAPRLYRDDLVALDRLLSVHVAVWEPEDCVERLRESWEDRERAHAEAEGRELPAPGELYEPLDGLLGRLDAAPVTLGDLPAAPPGRRTLELGGRPPRHFEGNLDDVLAALRTAQARGRPILLLARTPGRRRRLLEVLDDAGIERRVEGDDQPWAPVPGELVVAEGALDEGFELAPDGPIVFAEPDIFGPDPAPPPPRVRRGEGAFLGSLRDLKPGDLVVHVDHGVGRYTGLGRRPVTGEELLELEYGGGDRLFVPVSRLDLVQKYTGGERSLVPLDRLGGPGWDRRRSRVRKAVERIAGELLELYARRQAVRAPSFRGDSEWQREFEEAFPHALTEDQRSALAEIKQDLVGPRPMDRLLCGDVGYGKTEVALRAVFKVIESGYQAAVLVPTTVLASQHLATFRARMAAWPIRIEMVSRFASPAEVRERLAAVAAGDVDVLVGTHRLLARDVRFRRLGLLVIDEEQRFGVRHKEAIKKLAVGVHVLAMSATPIPRTLQMSLAGVRDLSVIETPPRNRLAIKTQLAPWSDSLLASALRAELRRGGQVFFIHPRVEGVERLRDQLAELVPEAQIGVAHGQLPEAQLERVMLDFVRGAVQVLVATTIIENGLDIPRANTIVVNQAHRFGLAQLYQMRGRVGRSDQRAYAYLLVPSRRELTPEARRRLGALVEFSDLGAGFRIAALDLEIRGAGELLGARQSGHIAAVGFEMYIGMLERAVRELRGQPIEHAPEPVSVNLGVEAHLPESLVPDPGQRLAIYKRISAAEHSDEVAALAEEAADRFGQLPEAARNLFRIARVRLEAAAQGAVSIDFADGFIAVRYGERPRVDADKIVDLLQRDPDVRVSPTGVVRLRVPDPRADRIAAASLALRKLTA